MNKITMLIGSIIAILLLTSCWDSRLLKDHSLILEIGYDLNDDETISKTVAFPEETVSNGTQEGGQSESEVITTIGKTVGAADIELERHLAQRFDRSKAQILLIGKKLAKHGIFKTLDSMYRDPRGPLNASVAVVDERAEEGLKVKKDQSFFKSEFYFGLLNSAEEDGIIKRQNVQSICPVLLSGRKDIMLPYIKVIGDKDAFIEGLALFSGDKMTGNLTNDQSIISLILTEEVKKNVKLNVRISDDEEDEQSNYVTFIIVKEKRDFNVFVESDKVKTNLDFYLRLEIDEYPKNNLQKQTEVEKLERQIAEQLKKLALETIETVQEANSDIFGIGERVRAHHYELWKSIDWKEVYPEVPIDVRFEVEITRHGIIN